MKTFRTFGKKAESPQQQQYSYNQQANYNEEPEQDLNQEEDFTDYQVNNNYRQVTRINNDDSYDQDASNKNYEGGRYNVKNPNQVIMYSNMQENANAKENDVEDNENEYETDASQEPNKKAKSVRINDDYTTDEEKPTDKDTKVEPREKYGFHFATKVRNSGYWGKVYLRNGTWMVIAGFIQFCISIVLIGVFWGFWYSNALNFPMRTLAITLLSTGCSMMVFGLICNYFMFWDRENKRILGSPLLPATKVLAVCLFLLVIASDCITVYYTFWSNRWVNTPLIIIAIILYFFAGIGALWALYTICDYNMVRYGYWRSEGENKARREKRKDMERRLRYLSQESIANKSLKSYDVLVSQQQEMMAFELEQERRRGFRKGHPVKLTPKPVILTSSAVASPNSTTNLQDI